jgi:GT2 family glycosyltransferase
MDQDLKGFDVEAAHIADEDFPAVAIVVLNWNGASDTIACLESLAELDYEPFGVIVCDNASSDNSIQLLQAWSVERLDTINDARQAAGKPAWRWRDLSGATSRTPLSDPSADGGPGVVTLIQTGGNLGYAGGNNVGLRYALAEGYDFCWIINNDTELDPRALGAMIERMREDPNIGICGSTLVYFEQRDTVQCLGGSAFSDFKGRSTPIGLGADPTHPIDRAAF